MAKQKTPPATICERCGQPLPEGRRRFCSNLCARRFHSELGQQRARETPIKRKRKRRGCLGCGAQFMSEGPWNRICGHCRNLWENRVGGDYIRKSHPIRPPHRGHADV